MSPRRKTFKGFLGTLKILLKEDKGVRTLAFTVIVVAITIFLKNCTHNVLQ